jgi:hypothetical protein
MKIKNWSKMAMGRETLKTIFEQAKTHQDLQRQEKKKVVV